MKSTIFTLLTGLFLFASCNKQLIEPVESDAKLVNLRIKNPNVGTNSISNLTVLLSNKDQVVIRTSIFTNVVFNSENEYAASIISPLSATTITVMGNSSDFTNYKSNNLLGKRLEDIYLMTDQISKSHPNYFNQPSNIFTGYSAVIFNHNDNTDVNINISRLVSQIVVELDPTLNFSANNGRGFYVTGSSVPISINGIDSMFILGTPSGINILSTSYYNPATLSSDEIVKPTLFDLTSSTNLATDSITVFPQIKAKTLPYIILSTRGFKGNTPFGGTSPSLYYGMRIKEVLLNNIPDNITSLPRNSIITVRVTNFQGGGSMVHPDPNQIGSVEALVSVKSWGDNYTSDGTME